MSDLIAASEIQPRKVQWLWRERIAKGTITVVAGKPDQGKGLFSAHVAADISRRGGKVLYSAIEDAADMMTRPRLEAAGADLKNILLWRFQLPTQQRELENIIIEEEIDLVCMDPFAAHLRGVSRFSDDVRNVITPLSGLIEQTGTAVLITEHALKRVSKGSHPLNAIGGSGSGLPAAARMAFLFGTDPDDSDKRCLAVVKNNLRDKPKALMFDSDVEELDIVGEIPYLILSGEVEFDAARLVEHNAEPGKVGRKPDRRAAAAEWITQYLAREGKPVPAGTVQEDAKHYGLNAKTLRRAAEDMGIVKNPPGGGRNCTWDLPNDLKQILGLPVTADNSDPLQGPVTAQQADQGFNTLADIEPFMLTVDADTLPIITDEEMNAELNEILGGADDEGVDDDG